MINCSFAGSVSYLRRGSNHAPCAMLQPKAHQSCTVCTVRESPLLACLQNVDHGGGGTPAQRGHGPPMILSAARPKQTNGKRCCQPGARWQASSGRVVNLSRFNSF